MGSYLYPNLLHILLYVRKELALSETLLYQILLTVNIIFLGMKMPTSIRIFLARWFILRLNMTRSSKNRRFVGQLFRGVKLESSIILVLIVLHVQDIFSYSQSLNVDLEQTSQLWLESSSVIKMSGFGPFIPCPQQKIARMQRKVR